MNMCNYAVHYASPRLVTLSLCSWNAGHYAFVVMCQLKGELIVLLFNCNPSYVTLRLVPQLLPPDSWCCVFIDLWFDCLRFRMKEQLKYVLLCTRLTNLQPLYSYENAIVLGLYTMFAKVHFSKWSVSESSRKTQVFWATTPCRLVVIDVSE